MIQDPSAPFLLQSVQLGQWLAPRLPTLVLLGLIGLLLAGLVLAMLSALLALVEGVARSGTCVPFLALARVGVIHVPSGCPALGRGARNREPRCGRPRVRERREGGNSHA
jgi:hypothetical protein